jgi:predicted  nucleic acid-binding Zn-ribbon protein
MSDLAKLDKRVTKLEREMGDVRKLAADASTDVGDVSAALRAHTRSIEALRETQIDFSKELRDQGKRMDAGFAELDGEMRKGFAEMAVGMAQITASLSIVMRESGEGS